MVALPASITTPDTPEDLVEIVIALAAIVGLVVLVALIRGRRQASDERHLADNPLDSELDEVFPRSGLTGRRRREAEDALRLATPHIQRATAETGSRPIFIHHTVSTFDDGLLVVTTAATMLFRSGTMRSIGHRAGTSKAISVSRDGTHAAVEVTSSEGSFRFTVDYLKTARLICSAIDGWAENPQLTPDPRIVISPKRVVIPDEYFVDVLRAAGHRVTTYNMRSLHERFGMQFCTKARTYLDATAGTAASKRFTAEYGRPDRDEDLPAWPARVLDGWRLVEPESAARLAFLPLLISDVLLDSSSTGGGYLSDPGRPLSMWKSEWYEDDGRGARRGDTGRGLDSVRA